MAITVYTYNDKVLKNVANDKWLKKPDAPAGFVMNASNAQYIERSRSYWVYWEAPSYPNTYNGNGKQYILVNNNEIGNNNMFLYSSTQLSGGPTAIDSPDMNVLGTSTGTLMNNEAPQAGFGVYFLWPFTGYTLEQAQAYIANVTITIVDP